mgnify:CR=1 FL=1
MIRFRALIAALTASLAGSAIAQSSAPAPAQPPCSAAQHRELDFWVGTWIATWDNPDGTKGTGKNVITRDEYGSCVITERFEIDNAPFKGFSISTYFAPAGEWRQTWMDNQGGYFDLFGGRSDDPAYAFFLEQYRRGDKSPFLRMIWQDVKPESFTWRWQKKASADAAWADQWVIRYTRSPAAAKSAAR